MDDRWWLLGDVWELLAWTAETTDRQIEVGKLREDGDADGCSANGMENPYVQRGARSANSEPAAVDDIQNPKTGRAEFEDRSAALPNPESAGGRRIEIFFKIS